MLDNLQAESGIEKSREIKKYTSSLAKGNITKKENVKICLFISIGKEHCEGEELRAQLKFLNSTFKSSKVFIILAGTLQRFTHQIHGMDAQAAEKKAIEDVSKWKENNQNIAAEELAAFEFEYVDWTNLTTMNQTFNLSLEKINKEYQNDPSFKRAYDKTAYDFIAAQLADKRVSYVDTEHGVNFCLEYLKEENAVNIILTNEGYDYACYPRHISDAIKITLDKFSTEKNSFSYLYIKNKEIKKNISQVHLIEKEKGDTAEKSSKKTLTESCNQNLFFNANRKNTIFSNNNINSILGYMQCILIVSKTDIDPSIKLMLINEFSKASLNYTEQVSGKSLTVL